MASNVTFSFVETFLMGFYVIDREKTSYQNPEDVPDFVPQMVPFFIVLFGMEQLYSWWHDKPMARLNDGITSVSLGMIMEVMALFTKTLALIGYGWLYQYRFFDFDWNSPVTWWTAALGVDLGYYWLHRMSHEIGIAWSGHQVHHSSEEYNLASALRQSAFQRFFSIGFYHPLALLGVPLPAVIAHLQFNLFYQFWIHTEAVGKLGPLEWVLNTPTHHKIHHGINKWCIDKNYAGFLIIWDRMFGTFEPLREEPIVYGLVDQPQTFNPFYLQTFYFRDCFNRALSQKTWTDTLKGIFYGPGWHPGTPRLGDMNEFPEKTPPRKAYNPYISNYLNVYVLIHFAITLYFHQTLSLHMQTFTWYTVLAFISFIFFSLFNIGAFFNAKWWAPVVEAARCIMFVTLLRHRPITGYPTADFFLIGYFALSALFWSSQSLVLFHTIEKKLS